MGVPSRPTRQRRPDRGPSDFGSSPGRCAHPRHPAEDLIHRSRSLLPAWECGVVTTDLTQALPPRAALLSEELLAPLGPRWLHVQSVAERAGFLAQLADPADRPSVVAAAWLHDIGYAPALVVTGLHPVDGARYLRENGWPE